MSNTETSTVVIRPNSIGKDMTVDVSPVFGNKGTIKSAAESFCRNIGLVMFDFKLTPADGDVTPEYATFTIGTGAKFTAFFK